jgi:phospholysine phosphohistidine inorganic pyrophosphate phosphatase
MVGDDLEADIDGAQKCGMKGVLVRTGKFRQEDLDRSAVHPDGVLDSIAELPEWLERREDWN